MAAPEEPLEQLTRRERQVLDLVRRGLTNEEIAHHLGITLDGAKYHVSQILSKLGVTSREEAAALVAQERWRQWIRVAAWPAAGKLAGAAVVAAALAGLAVLAWSVLANESEAPADPSVFDRTVEEILTTALETISGDGMVLHMTVTSTPVETNDGGEVIPVSEWWIDESAGAIRAKSIGVSEGERAESERIYLDDFVYYPDDPGEALRDEWTSEARCPASESRTIAIIFGCGANSFSIYLSAEESGDPRIEAGEYEGRNVTLLVVEGAFTVPEFGDEPEPVLPGETRTPIGERTADVTVTYYLAPDTFLPLAMTQIIGNQGETTAITATYENEIIARDSLSDDYFDPRSIGYGAAQVRPLLDQIEERVPVYWLGEEFELTSDCPQDSPITYCEFVLTEVVAGGSLDEAGRLVYASPSGVNLLVLRFWERPTWNEYFETLNQQLLSHPGCTDRTETDVNGQPLVVYTLPRISFPVPEDFECGIRLRDSLIGPQNTFAFSELGGVIVEIKPDWNNAYDTASGVALILANLRRP